MEPGAFYEFIPIRGLGINTEEGRDTYYEPEDSPIIEEIGEIKTGDIVVFLESFLFQRDDNSYQTFIKVLNANSCCGWVIWFSGEWEKVQ